MTVDVLAIAAHPDDVEITCGGLMIRMADLGYKTGVLDLTRGEMGTKGTPDTRLAEAEAAGRILGLSVRENAGLPDSRLAVTDESREAVAMFIRRLRPRLAIIPPASSVIPITMPQATSPMQASGRRGFRRFRWRGKRIVPSAFSMPRLSTSTSPPSTSTSRTNLSASWRRWPPIVRSLPRERSGSTCPTPT
jgi:hypothetical protein